MSNKDNKLYLRIHTGAAILAVARVYPSIMEAFNQGPQNGHDAIKRMTDTPGFHDTKYRGKLLIVIRDDKVIISDNGDGMNGHMTDVARGLLNFFFKLHSDLPSKEEILKQIGIESRQTLEWMLTSIGFSGQTGDFVKGMMGFGATGHLYWANYARIRTRPVGPLHHLRYGDTEERPVFEADLVSADNIAANVIPTEVRVDTENPLLDAYGVQMDHGTTLEIWGIHKRMPSHAKIRTFLTGEYGRASDRMDIILDTGAEISQIEAVEAQEGLVMVEEKIHIPGGFKVPIRLGYNVDGKSGLKIIWQDGELKARTVLAEYAEELSHLLGGDVCGEIIIPNELKIKSWFNPGKTAFIGDDRRLAFFINALAKVNERLPELITDAKNAIKKDRSSQIGEIISSVLSQALKDTDIFASLTEPVTPEPKTGKSRTGRRKGISEEKVYSDLVVSVTDEHSQGVKDIQIILWLPKDQWIKGSKDGVSIGYVMRTTHHSGRLTFGPLKPGEYTVELNSDLEFLPSGVVPVGNTKKRILMTEKKIGDRVHFKVVTGRERPSDIGRLPQIKALPVPLSDPVAPWHTDLPEQPVIYVNTRPGLPLMDALESGDVDMAAALLAEYITKALTYHVAREEKGLGIYLALQSSVHFGALFIGFRNGLEEIFKSTPRK